MRVGFIGIGRMGSAIAGRVLEGGNELTIWNRTPEKTVELAERGARVASSVAEACTGAEAVLTMLANDEVLLEVALGPGGIVESLCGLVCVTRPMFSEPTQHVRVFNHPMHRPPVT